MSKDRKKFTENENILLYSEVDGVCPKCAKPLMYEKVSSLQKRYQIAHIYPLNAKPEEKTLLKAEEKLSNDLNDLKNLICLCVDCHTIFDKPRTVKEYREMIAIKKQIIAKHNEKGEWINNQLEPEIIDILENLAKDETDMDFEDDILDYDPKTIDDKTNTSITNLTKRKIQLYVEEYYKFMKLKFKHLDSIDPMTTEIISSQIKTFYLKMKSQSANQLVIYNSISDWIYVKSGKKSKDASDVIVAYFIQNCEIF